MLVLDGHPVELDAHLERLEASLSTLYSAWLPGGARDAVLDNARGVRHGKLRLTAVPRAGGPPLTRIATAEVEAGKVFPAADRGAALRSFVVNGGLGDHKWADRRTDPAQHRSPAGNRGRPRRRDRGVRAEADTR